MLMLKRRLAKAGIVQRQMAAEIGCAVSTLNEIINKGKFPKRTRQQIKSAIEVYLNKQGVSVEGIWRKISKKGAPVKHAPKPKKKEVIKMLTHTALEHFNLKQNPFFGEIFDLSDYYYPESFQNTEKSIINAIPRHLLLSLIADMGTGKTLMKRKILDQYKNNKKIKFIQTKSAASEKLLLTAICDAVIWELKDINEKTKRSQEGKERLMEKFLLEEMKAGRIVILIIDEAHMLHKATIKGLKRLIDDLYYGFQPLLRIWLIGQEELRAKLAEGEMKEVSFRIQIIDMPSFNGLGESYLQFKIKRAGGKLEEIFDEKAIQLLLRTAKTPLAINYQASKALVFAHDRGEARVLPEMINHI